MSHNQILAEITAAAGFKTGEQYSAQRVIQALRDQGRQEAMAEYVSERAELLQAWSEVQGALARLVTPKPRAPVVPDEPELPIFEDIKAISDREWRKERA